MYYSEELIEEVRMRNDIVHVISGYVKLQKREVPTLDLLFHNEKFSVILSQQGRNRCTIVSGCGAGGNVFTFIMEYENYSFVEALKFLPERRELICLR